ncbi:uncharacterized protein J3R85_005552 [Psidium guajava]|nr:uncharacterized protein J3R85_005552 [Psidium guajava]
MQLLNRKAASPPDSSLRFLLAGFLGEGADIHAQSHALPSEISVFLLLRISFRFGSG